MRKTYSTEYRGITDLEFVEVYIERLNRQIERLPTEIIFQTKKDEPLFEEDIDYARQCADEKWRSNH